MLRPAVFRLAALAVAALAGCAQLGDSPAPPAGRDVIGREAVTYAGDIPCADCPGQRLTVTLFPDSTFRLRRVYKDAMDGRDRTFHDLGRWARAQDDGAGRLRLAGSETRQFLVWGPEALRMLDGQGREIRSALNYELKRVAATDPVAGPMRVRGLYSYMADAASFTECLTGKRYPVRIERNHVALERAYLAAPHAPGEPVLATFDGRFVTAPAERGTPPREQLVVERFDRLWPGESCSPQAKTAAPLLDTYWRPAEIEGKAFDLRPGTREPHLVFMAGNRVRGYAGCNNLTGGFETAGDRLRFTGVATTRMACVGPGTETEARFLSALNTTVAHRITPDGLELLDKTGGVRMRLEARPMR